MSSGFRNAETEPLLGVEIDVDAVDTTDGVE